MKTILVTGATGKQGGSVIDALLKANAPYEILALTRDAQSASSKRLLAKSSTIKLITGNLDATEDVFSKAKKVTKTPIWGVFSVQPVGKNETAQGKALVDASLKHGVSHFVYTSVDRGVNSDTDPTNVPHFITKYNIEQHLFSKAKDSKMTYTVLRPVGFLDNVTPDFFGKIFTTSWAVKLPKTQKLPLVATSDIGEFAAQALLKHQDATFRNKSISLSSEALSFEELNAIFEKTTGEKLPMTYGPVARVVLGLARELGIMFNWFRDVGFAANFDECKAIHPEMKGLEKWLETESVWKKN
ncbi:hypothetical protein GMOD_00007899 [Pyrenophora seminiperda CCB06]|uniref:NmrA-like domain-containing protein n=1 Tax=Pyrenophora seminiperda CCB06 TaxID=1302712 RepID=A0A3M7MG34_9PLEO|nr:hypothetical protein GMOD_00007899 [Pyrenophora seminiperda CCB06]